MFARLNTDKYRERTPPIWCVGTGADIRPGAALLLPIRLTTLPYAGLAHVYTDRVVRNVFHDGIGMDL